MSKPFGNIARHIALLLCRLSLGSFFLLHGFQKVQGEVEQLGAFYHSSIFQSRQPPWLSDVLAAPYGYALPWVELTVGGLLILGLFGRVTAGVMSLVLLSITIALLSVGGHGGTVHTDCIYFTLALLLMVLGPGGFSIDGLWRKKAGARG